MENAYKLVFVLKSRKPTRNNDNRYKRFIVYFYPIGCRAFDLFNVVIVYNILLFLTIW